VENKSQLQNKLERMYKNKLPSIHELSENSPTLEDPEEKGLLAAVEKQMISSSDRI
jgi:hypothetical protein